jgi:purine-binding chemotaxis protein CheW
MNSGPALDDYLMELLGDVGVAVAPMRPAPTAVVAPETESDEAVFVLEAMDGADIEASAVDPATVASIIEEMEKEFAPRLESTMATVQEPITQPVAVLVDAIIQAVPEVAPASDAVAARVAPSPPTPAAHAPLPISAPRLPPSGSPAMTLLSPVATPRALPPLPSKPFLQTPLEGGARRRAAEPTTRWLRMRCDDQHYALELLKVQEVVLPGALLPLRGAARHMLGVMNLRGQVVPVVDLGLYLGRRPIEQDASTRIVVLEEQGEILGLRVSAVEDVTNLTEQQIEPPDNARVGRIANHLFRGVARLHQRAVILLDASQLLK